MPYLDTKDSKVVHIGFDDTDSIAGRCTTHLAFKIVSKLMNETGITFIDYPLLVRLNPNIPWKTRGNGAVCLRIKTDRLDQMIDYLSKILTSESDMTNGANPGLAILEGDSVPFPLRQFSNRAMNDVIGIEEAEKLAARLSIQIFKYGQGLGIIGAMASIGSLLEGDHTFEAIAYRKDEYVGLPRKLDKSKVSKVDINTYPLTFNCFDKIHDRVLIAPHGPDPVYCGIRGEDPQTVISSLQKVMPMEKLEGYMVFRTNQGTNMHLQNELPHGEIRTHRAGYIRCVVTKKPVIIRGGHVMFEVSNFSNKQYPVAVYEPTGLGSIASKLLEGDRIDIGIGVSMNSPHSSNILNVEYLSILKKSKEIVSINPPCDKCGKRMKSEGKDKGFQCKNCGDKKDSKVSITNPRDIHLGMYLPYSRAHRHLTKPLHRFGMEKNYPNVPNILKPLHSEWFKRL